MNDDRDINDLLKQTAAGITPQGSYEEIKERAMRENTNRRWVLPSLAAAAAMVLVVGGVGFLLRDDDKAATPGPADQPSSQPSGTPTAVSPEQVDVTVYVAGSTTQGHGLFAETRQVDELDGAGTPDLEKAVQLALSGRPTDGDYRTLWPEGVSVRDVGFSGGTGDDGVITVSLLGPAADRPDGTSTRDAGLAIEAVVRTVQGVAALADVPQATSPVEFLVDGEPTPSVLGVRAANFLPGDDDEVLAPIQITNLAEGQTVPAGTVEVSGVAAAFEANVLWEVQDASGTTVQDGFTTAAECCTLAPYSFTVDLEPGTYTVVVHDEDMSGEGRPVNEDTKRIVVD